MPPVLSGGSLTIWGRTGFDGDTSGLWLHAELIASLKRSQKNSCQQQRFRTRGLIDRDAHPVVAHAAGPGVIKVS
jgi:hypothetical protein